MTTPKPQFGLAAAPLRAGRGAVAASAQAPRASVIIPHLNEPDNLRRCLQSLEDQRIDGIFFEVIVVDNGSAELPTAVCSQFEGVRLEQERVPGPGPARNRGVLCAHGDLLAFIDADCIAQPGWIRSLVEGMDDDPDIAFAGGDIGIVQADPDHPTAIEAYETVFSYRAALYAKRGYTATGNMVVRNDVFRAVGPFGGITSMEDTEWGLRATSLGYRVAYLPAAKVLTPSCKSFDELARRWDRHIAHDYGKLDPSAASRVLWLLRSCALAISPVLETVRIARSDRISGALMRWRALACVTHVRLYRARRMLELARHGNAAAMVRQWNREVF